jgi:hypothetical protein
MNSAKPSKQDMIVRRRLIHGTAESSPPTHFRSWHEQSVPKHQREGKQPEKPGKVPPKGRKKHYSYWQSRDFHVVIACLGTVIVATAVYYLMK